MRNYWWRWQRHEKVRFFSVLAMFIMLAAVIWFLAFYIAEAGATESALRSQVSELRKTEAQFDNCLQGKPVGRSKDGSVLFCGEPMEVKI